MALSGPPPKAPGRRARRNAGALDTTWLTVMSNPAPQPELPDDVDFEWHPATRRWWAVWGASPQAAYFSPTDWESMLTTARIHTMTMRHPSEPKFVAELRLREGLVGGTPADRAKLRMVLAQAEEAEDRNERRKASSARERRGALKALPHEAAASE